MTILHLKCEFPYNWYSVRNLKLSDDKGNVFRIMSGQSRKLEIPSESSRLKMRLDYMSAQVDLPKDRDDQYVIIYLKVRQGFVGAMLDAFKPSALQLKSVTAEEFSRFAPEFYAVTQQKPKGIGSVDVFSFLILVALAGLLTVLGVVKEHWGDFGNLLFATGLLSLISLSILWFDRKSIGVKSYRIRQITIGVVTFGMLIYASKLGYQHAWWLALLPILAILRTFTVKFSNNTALSA
jgi:hypothetical protein